MSAPGWNDPPQFSHTSLDSQGIKRSKLTKRPAHPHPTPPPPSHTPPLTSTTPPHNPPPLSNVSKKSPPIPTEIGHSETVGREGVSGVTDSMTSESSGGEFCDYSGVVDGLYAQLEKYKTSMQRREVDEVGKRLEAMRRQWQEGALSPPVMAQMNSLLQALEESKVAVAQSIQIALMVDHTSEVSLWMMGVKRIISRAEKETDHEP